MTALNLYRRDLTQCTERGPVEGWPLIGGRYVRPGHLKVLEQIVGVAADRGHTIPHDALDRAAIAWETALLFALEHLRDPTEGDRFVIESVIAEFER